MVLSFREDYPEVILNKNKDGDGTDDGPYRYQSCVFIRIDRFGFAHGFETAAATVSTDIEWTNTPGLKLRPIELKLA